MLISNFYNLSANQLSFSRKQGSDFAKLVADDFNPLHDTEAKRFCIPGDLLFSVVLDHYGCSQKMAFDFAGMVTNEVTLVLPEDSAQMTIADSAGKKYLTIDKSGTNSSNSELINNLVKSYVSFSGKTFPHILVPLMQEKGVMINPTRPMVMYQSMLIDLDRIDLTDIELTLDEDNTVFEVNGKRGSVCLAFNLIADNIVVGRGEKHMVASGLKPYEQSAMDEIIKDYTQWKSQYNA